MATAAYVCLSALSYPRGPASWSCCLTVDTDSIQHVKFHLQPHPLLSFQTKQPSLSVVPLDEAERILSLQLALKCSDMGHISADLAVHLRWVSALEEEVRMGSPQGQCTWTVLSCCCSRPLYLTGIWYPTCICCLHFAWMHIIWRGCQSFVMQLFIPDIRKIRFTISILCYNQGNVPVGKHYCFQAAYP